MTIAIAAIHRHAEPGAAGLTGSIAAVAGAPDAAATGSIGGDSFGFKAAMDRS